MSRESPIPIDRTRSNTDQRGRANQAREEASREERYRRDQGVNDRPGVDDSESGPPDQPGGPGRSERHEGAKLMASEKQRAAARRNITKAQTAAREKRTIAKLPKSTRTALGKQGAKVARQKPG
jgi:hypothetical protein